MPDPTPKMDEIARRITVHLRRMEKAQPDLGQAGSQYWCPRACPAGSRIAVRYISYQHDRFLKKSEAWQCLQWLDAGNEGQHQEVSHG